MKKADLLNHMGDLVKKWRSKAKQNETGGYGVCADDLYDLMVEAQKVPEHEAMLYKSMAATHNLPPLGTEFIGRRDGKRYVIEGWNYRTTKNPVKIRCLDNNKRYTCPPGFVTLDANGGQK